MSDGSMKNRILELPVTWTSAAGGGVSVILPNYHGYKLHSVMTAPGANGNLTTDCPDPAYDVVINNAYSEDVMEGELANQSDADAATIYSDPPICITTALTVVVSNAGAAKQGFLLLALEQN